MYSCPRCKLEFNSYNSLSKHTRTAYKLSGEALYREYHHIQDTPMCQCGCGTPTKWRIDTGYGKYVSGHNAKGSSNPMFGKSHSEEAKQNISSKRKEKFASGEYTFITHDKWSTAAKQVWSTGGHREKMKLARSNSGWKKKLSEAMSGSNHPYFGKLRPEHSKLMKSPEMMKRIFSKRSMTDIETLMVNMLSDMGVEYYSQFFITHEKNTYAYDFKLKDLPVLIEVDGDYWHGGPGANKHVPFVTEVRDKDNIKDIIAQQHGYTVLRFWGSDVKERPFWVIQQILNQLQPHYNHPPANAARISSDM